MGSYWERVTTLVYDIHLNCDEFVLKGVYHNGCMTKYLLKSSPKNEQKQDSGLSSNEMSNLLVVWLFG
jgi:hypothetical protein